ncbi:hypothetical protein [Actinoplanes subtropicus]|uniref:hypothetical protein n=1 Tax=Actinoplanes subtropicus TaxID=543632 RepID=UPI0012F9E681|nr:hypothetical protein [Actinoplanes subtropicus]
MIDFEKAVVGLPQAERFPGLSGAWRWFRAPRWYGALAVSEDGRIAFEMRGLDVFDEDLVRAVLAFARTERLFADRPLVTASGFRHEPFDFDVVAACPPDVHTYHQGENETLHAAVTAVFPAYACECSGSENMEDAKYRFTHMLQPTVLTRRPVPFLKMRFENTRTGGGSIGPKRGFTTLDVLRRELRELGADAPGSFVEFENSHGEVRRIEPLNGAWAVTGASVETVRPENLDEWVNAQVCDLIE